MPILRQLPQTVTQVPPPEEESGGWTPELVRDVWPDVREDAKKLYRAMANEPLGVAADKLAALMPDKTPYDIGGILSSVGHQIRRRGLSLPRPLERPGGKFRLSPVWREVILSERGSSVKGGEMLALTRVESEIRDELVRVARRCELTHYEAIAPIAGLDMGNPDHRTRIGSILGNISSFEHQYSRPMLSAVVVHKGGNEPGQGFFNCAADLGLFSGHAPDQRMEFFVRELRRLYAYWGKAHVEA